jgi:uncharacterized membrane protein YheB (UPF0754 family)
MEDSEFCMFHNKYSVEWRDLPSLKDVVEKHITEQKQSLTMVHIPHSHYICNRNSIFESIEYLHDKYNYSFKFNHRNVLVYRSRFKMEKQRRKQQLSNYSKQKYDTMAIENSLFTYFIIIFYLRIVELLYKLNLNN